MPQTPGPGHHAGAGLKNLKQYGDVKMGKKVIIDTDECTGCETCVELCPDVFEFDEDTELARVILEEGGPEDCIQEAIDSCPVECIHWKE
jgi:ferredoxin